MTPLALAIPLIVLAVLAVAAAVYYGAVLARTIRAERALPTLRDGLRLADERAAAAWPSVLLVVPAHNEEDVIERHVRSIGAQEYPGEFRAVFALDRCTDRTEELARRAIESLPESRRLRLSMTTISECPSDWAGKVHAIHQGVLSARAGTPPDLLLFADADTVFDPACLRAAVALMESRNLHLLSLLSTLTRERWFESVAQPAAGFELVRQFPLDAVNRARKPRAFANGQFMLWARDAYDALGGHGAVKHELLEDIAFARLMQWKTRDRKWGVFMADGLLLCSMYRSWPAFTRGWKRIYTEAAHRRPGRLLASAYRLLVTGVVLSCAGPMALVAGAVMFTRNDPPLAWSLLIAGVAATVIAWLALGRVYRAQRVPIGWIGAYPLGAWLVFRLLRRAGKDLTRGRATKWGGREYAREARE